jgi:enterochelin esterase-like enzyme
MVHSGSVMFTGRPNLKFQRSTMNLRLILPLLSFALSYSLVGYGQTTGTPSSTKPTTGARNGGLDQPLNWTEAQPGTAKGKVEMFSIEDNEYKRKRRVWVYTPPNYNRNSAAPYSLLICFDGSSYINDIPAPTILDNLLAAHKIQPTVAVMVDNEEARLGDLANHQTFVDFMSRDLLPWVRKTYHVAPDPDKTILCGYSVGGLAAAYVAFRRPDLFGNVLSQSGAFWRGNEGGTDDLEWLTMQFKNSPKLSLRFYLEVGALETGKTAGGPVFIEATRRLRQVLKDKGYDLRYEEIPGARHEPAHWRRQLAEGLIYLAGKS